MGDAVKPAAAELKKQVRALRRRGLSLETIAAQTGVSRSAAGRITADMKADARAKANRTRFADSGEPLWLYEARRMLRADGLTRNQIAARLGVPKSTLYRWLS